MQMRSDFQIRSNYLIFSAVSVLSSLGIFIKLKFPMRFLNERLQKILLEINFELYIMC